jgi:putative copper export protein
MKNALTLIATGKAKVMALLFLALAAVNSFAQEVSGIEQMQTAVTEQISGLQGAVIAIGVVIIGIAAVVGAVMLFKSLARRV